MLPTVESVPLTDEERIRAVLALYADDVDAAWLDFEPQDVHAGGDEEEYPR